MTDDILLLDDPWSVDSAGFSEAGTARDRLVFLLNYAALAPSVLATEPWRFDVVDDSVSLLADWSRKLPVTDPMGRQLLISCGAALLNVRIAAESYGQGLDIKLLPDEHRPELLAELTLGRTTSASGHRLRSAIIKRRTNRGAFEDRPLSANLAATLTDAARQEGATLWVLRDKKAQQSVLALTMEARQAQLASSAYRSEVLEWVEKRLAEARDSNSEARHRLGLYTSSSAGHTPEPLKRPELDTAVAAGHARSFASGTCHDKSREKLSKSSMLALLTTDSDAKEGWLSAGQALERVLLVAAAEGISASYLNAPIEVDKLRQRVTGTFDATGHPQVILRLGFGGERPPTPRRPMNEIVKVMESHTGNTGPIRPR